MKIAICCSITFYDEVKELSQKLEALGHKVTIPRSIEKILKNETTLDQIDESKNDLNPDSNKAKFDLITGYMDKIKSSDTILVANYDKNGIQNYIGGNTLMEMAFALADGKNIYLLNPIPDMSYTDEIAGCLPVVINRDLSLIK